MRDEDRRLTQACDVAAREIYIARDHLKRRGFNFVGSTICYALMQAVGMVNDHLVTCFRHSEIAKRR